VGAIIGGILVLVPFLWALGYKNQRLYELDPVVAEQEVIVPEAQPVEKSKADKIRELKKLLDDGLITEEEYKAAKRQILFSESAL